MLDQRTRVELGDVEARRELCGTYTDQRSGETIQVNGCALRFAQTVVASPLHPEGWQSYGEYAWPTVLRLVTEGTWTREDDRP